MGPGTICRSQPCFEALKPLVTHCRLLTKKLAKCGEASSFFGARNLWQMWGRLLNRLSIIVKKNPNISLLKIGRPNSLLTVVPKNVRLPWSSLVLSRIVRLQFLSPQQAWQLWIIIESPSYLENASLRWPILTFWAFETKSSPLLFRFTSHFYLLGEGSIHNTPRSIFFSKTTTLWQWMAGSKSPRKVP